MGATKQESKLKVEEESQKGTGLSVTLVGAVILITYFVLFGLYMGRV
ncbi:hypothetical protein V7122_09080 [Bacillus sp. JJ1532]